MHIFPESCGAPIYVHLWHWRVAPLPGQILIIGSSVTSVQIRLFFRWEDFVIAVMVHIWKWSDEVPFAHSPLFWRKRGQLPGAIVVTRTGDTQPLAFILLEHRFTRKRHG